MAGWLRFRLAVEGFARHCLDISSKRTTADAPHRMAGQKMMKINNSRLLIWSRVALKNGLDFCIRIRMSKGSQLKRHHRQRRDGHVQAGRAAVERNVFRHHCAGIAQIGAAE